MDPSLPRLNLTDAERERFAVYLEMESKSSEEMARQVETLGAAHAPMVKKMRAEAMAQKIVAMNLRAITTETF